MLPLIQHLVDYGIVELWKQPLSIAGWSQPTVYPKLEIGIGIGNISTLATFPQ